MSRGINSRKTNNCSNYGTMSASEVLGSKNHKLAFSGKWALWLGFPKPNFHAIMSGQPGYGKSTASKQFANYLAKNFGRVIYFADEEDVALVQDGLKKIGSSEFKDSPNLRICFKDPWTGGKITLKTIRKILKLGNYNFWFIDSLQSVGIDAKELSALYEEFPNMGTCGISRETKNGKARGSQDKEYDDDITIRFEKVGTATTTKNRFNKLGNLVIFETDDNAEEDEDYEPRPRKRRTSRRSVGRRH